MVEENYDVLGLQKVICRVETQDGGDAKIEVSPRDIIYTEPAEPSENEQPVVLHKLDFRYGGISWCDDSLALVYESWYRTRRLRTWIISPGCESASSRILFDRSSEDVYSDPGSPMMRKTSIGTYVIAKIKKESDEGTYLLLNGSGATPQGNIPFLDLFDMFAILSGPTIPIIGEGNEEANDRYVEQLVASAEAAVEEVIRRGVAHPDKIAVGGHSYGAFMTANLLAHAPHLFCCGIARSGAYNRTLTPFGFQNEDRTLWEAVDTYVEMSPFISANKIKKPILLIHGEEDNNPGTLTMQSDRFYNALKGHGALCRLVILPFESHGYAARESVMHVLWETDRWLQKYCVTANSSDAGEDPNEHEEVASSNISDGESKVGAAGGVAERPDHEIDQIHTMHRSSLW
ncbi:UNVERIFIED_CONTAM: putative glutamyl endopeptidase, chloroplastic [Sesamum angustifolium]|uniref:Glutamyl endopeptidase, chloroplastic n=1 Tax=Sesamum angustifolium TaxID=2727405 RepID=A0AAW2QUZ3_9LAMI